MPKLHRLTQAGIERFQEFLDSQGTTEAQAFDLETLTNPKFAVLAGDTPDVPEECCFTTRFDAAEGVAPIIEAAKLEDPALDRGVWCWLSWLWFESLCATKNGYRDPKGSERWILDLDYKRYYRHLLAGPWFIYNTHRSDPERARALLFTDVNKPGELVGQIAASQELVSNPGLVEMVTCLYYDPDKKKLRRGHGDKVHGGARRLVKVIKQLDMIWDLYSTPADEFLALLPAEFDRFKTTSTR
jgi:hypothetical protein